MTERVGYDGTYRRVLGIGLLVSLAVHGAILAWGRLEVAAVTERNPTEPGTELALAFADEQPVELLDMRVLEAEVSVETAPAPDAETSSVEASLDLEPPPLASAQEGALLAVNPVEIGETDVGAAIEFDRLGAAVAAASRGGNDHDFERLGGFRIPEGSGRRGPLIIGGGGSGCQGPDVIRLPGRRTGRIALPGAGTGGFSGYGIGSRFSPP